MRYDKWREKGVVMSNAVMSIAVVSIAVMSVRAVKSVRGGEAEGGGRRRKAAGSKQKTRTPHSDVGNSINATGR